MNKDELDKIANAMAHKAYEIHVEAGIAKQSLGDFIEQYLEFYRALAEAAFEAA